MTEHIHEPAWVEHAIWWRAYPLGFTGAYPAPHDADAHRLLRLIPWLDHVIELGCSGIALGPIFTSATHGYDTLDHYEIDPRLGTLDDFERLVSEAHDRGLRIQLDGVFNHIGRGHPIAAAALREGPRTDSLLRTDARGAARAFVAFEGHEQLLTLNHDSERVRDLVVDVMSTWLERGADAWRLDAAYAVPTEFWAAVLPEVRRRYPDVWFEAEVIHGDYAEFAAASSVDAVTQYELWKAIWSSLNDRNFYELAWALARHNEMLERFVPTTFVGNHDVTRIASQIADPRDLDHALVLLALLGGTPEIYSGDEFGFRAVKEERAGGDDAIRPEFPASPDELVGADARTYHLHQRLLGLRRRHPWLHRARSKAVEVANERLVLALTSGDQALRLTLNLGDAAGPLGPGELVDCDDATRGLTGSVAPHGWSVQA